MHYKLYINNDVYICKSVGNKANWPTVRKANHSVSVGIFKLADICSNDGVLFHQRLLLSLLTFLVSYNIEHFFPSEEENRGNMPGVTQCNSNKKKQFEILNKMTLFFLNLILWIKIRCVSLHQLRALPATQWDQDTLHVTTVTLSRVGCVTTLHRRGTKVSCFHLQPCCSILKAFWWFLINASLDVAGMAVSSIKIQTLSQFFLFLKKKRKK